MALELEGLGLQNLRVSGVIIFGLKGVQGV